MRPLQEIFLLDFVKRPLKIGIGTAFTYWLLTLPWLGFVPFATQYQFDNPGRFLGLFVGILATGILGNWLWRIYQPKEIWKVLAVDVPLTGAAVVAAYSFFGIGSPYFTLFPYYVLLNYAPATIFGLLALVILLGLIANYPQLKKQGYVKAF